MPIPAILPLVFLALAFFLLPFAGEERFFSMRVKPEWLASKAALVTRRRYQSTVVLVALVSTAAAVLFETHQHLAFLVPMLEVAGLGAAWSWGWNRTLPSRLKQPVTRMAVLGSKPAAKAAGLWSLAALLPIVATAIVLVSRYSSIPISFATHFGTNGANSLVLRSWRSVFGPLMAGGAVVLLLVELLRVIERRGAGVADKGRYSTLTRRFMVGVIWLVALECAGSGLLPLVPQAGSYAMHLELVSGVAALVVLLITTGVLVGNRSVLISGQATTDEAHWKGGLLYFNREDAALFVPKRLGFGWTLNMAQPVAWLLMALVLAIALVPLALKHL